MKKPKKTLLAVMLGKSPLKGLNPVSACAKLIRGKSKAKAAPAKNRGS